jgi:amino-acid N-acetyltransferase
MIKRHVTDQAAFEAFRAFLAENELPNADLTLTDNYLVAYYDENGTMIATGALEFYSSYSLLRSIAVCNELRGKSLGGKIVSDLMNEARRRDVSEIFLLTETASIFFEKIGFKKMDRDHVPKSLKASTEFASVCSVSAVCMSYNLYS